jgi:hypothetical protein
MRRHLALMLKKQRVTAASECRHERARDSTDRHVNRWYLVDQHSVEHLAMVGMERDVGDGHYIYEPQPHFARLVPITHCSNQNHVQHWLENFVTHHALESQVHVGDHICTVRATMCSLLGGRSTIPPFSSLVADVAPIRPICSACSCLVCFAPCLVVRVVTTC